MNEANESRITLGRVITIVIALIFVIAGVYRICKAFSNDTDKDEKDNRVMMNEVIADKDGVEYCVTKVTNLKTIEDGYSEITTDNNFVVVSIRITNNSNDPYDVNSLRFLLVEGKDEYEHTNDALFAFDDIMFLDTINPNISKEYKIVYETPTATTEGEYMMKIKPNAFLEDDCVYIALNEAT